ncbi:hypothetical protein TNCV_3031001 [Trichonephila clavipes]|nr:hypothetical protein TNCV_3031001 [Trichonephila clavipes]
MFIDLHPYLCEYGSLRSNMHSENESRLLFHALLWAMTAQITGLFASLFVYKYGSLRSNMHSVNESRLLFNVSRRAMIAQITGVVQVCFLKCSREQRHLSANEDVSDHGMLCKSESL